MGPGSLNEQSDIREVAPSLASSLAPPLVVDMDGTLLRCDTLHEALVARISAEPLALARLLGWLRLDRADFKRRIADEIVVDPEHLPLNGDVVAEIEAARAEGRRIALVSASDARQVEAVARHVGLFDEWHGTPPDGSGENLKGAAKARFLTARYPQGFDYIGDSRADLAVWQAARRAITVDASEGLRAAAAQAAPEVRHLGQSSREIRPYLKALRPHQWVKNLLIFLPILAAQELGGIWAALVAFVAFSLTASSVYVVNDLMDLTADREHPRKRLRPFAAGSIPITEGGLMAVGLLGVALLLSVLFTPVLFLAVLAGYYALTLGYSLVLKRRLIVDIWTLAALYTVRILAGAAATGVMLSPWMLAFSMFLFFALAAVKRQGEMTDKLNRGETVAAGRAYSTDDLPILRGMALSAGYGAVLVFALYINSPAVEGLYPNPLVLWLVPPLLLFWVSHVVMATHRGWMHDDPITYAATNRTSQIVGVLILAVLAVAGGMVG